MTLTTHIRGLFVIPRLALDMLYLHTKFGDSRFSRSGDGDMTTVVETDNGSRDPNHTPFRGGLSSKR